VSDGIERALNEDPRPGQKRKLDGRAEAILIATACSDAHEWHERWTLRLLVGELVQLEVVASISHETVHRTLKKQVESKEVIISKTCHSLSQTANRC